MARTSPAKERDHGLGLLSQKGVKTVNGAQLLLWFLLWFFGPTTYTIGFFDYQAGFHGLPILWLS
jgi:hypothetical protein